tara:strand:- start:10519 stop:12132 length:1614 start_codon:yes stop_codon:yes gene_type:complete
MEYFDLNKNIDNDNLQDLEIIHELYTEAKTKYEKINITNKKFNEFYLSTYKFRNRLGELRNETYWVNFMRTLLRYRYRCAVSPLPFSHYSNLDGLNDFSELREQIKNCEIHFPEFKAHAINLVDMYKELSQSDDNPFSEKLEDVLNKFYQRKCAIILKSQSSYDYISRVFEDNKYLKILKESEYRKSNNNYDVVIFLGHHSWYDHYLYTSIKSKNLVGICYDFIGGKKIEPLSFSHPLWNRNITSIKYENEIINLTKYVEDSPEDLSDEIEIEYIQNNMDKKFGETSEEQLNTRLANLAGGYIVFLRNHEGIDTTQDVLNFETNISFNPKEVSDIQPGDYILLRTGADRDLTFEEANELMGKNAQKNRDLQKSWKNKLKEHITDNYSDNTIQISSLRAEAENKFMASLNDKGINLNRSKLRGWLREEAIKPRDDNEFKIVLEEIFGKDKNFQKYIIAMSEINRKHISAGSIVRKKILNLIQGSDLSLLEQNGYQEFKLQDTNASISVYRVLKISNRDKLQWRSQTDIPIKAKDIIDD